jgi:hypothetical protein
VAVACGEQHSLALLDDGSVLAWGAGDLAQARPPPDVANGAAGAIAIAAGAHHSVVLLGNGSMVLFGSNDTGQLGPPLGGAARWRQVQQSTILLWFDRSDGDDDKNNDDDDDDEGDARLRRAASGAAAAAAAPHTSAVTGIAAGTSHTLALVGDEVFAWGETRQGQAAVPARAFSGVRAVAAGGMASYALREDGTLVVWGRDDGQYAAEQLRHVRQIAAGQAHMAALLEDGQVRLYGKDNAGLPVRDVGVGGWVGVRRRGGSWSSSTGISMKDLGCRGTGLCIHAPPPSHSLLLPVHVSGRAGTIAVQLA